MSPRWRTTGQNGPAAGRPDKEKIPLHWKAMLFNRKSRALNFIASADAARDAGRWELAAQLYRQALHWMPRNSGIWVQYAHVLKESSKFADSDKLAQAEAAYRRAISIHPTASDTHVHLAQVLRAQGRLAEAVRACAQALFLDPTRDDAKRELGSSETVDIISSVSAARSGLPSAPANTNAAAPSRRKRRLDRLIGQGNRARDASQWAAAVDFYRAALSHDPHNMSIWVQYGHALKEAGELRDISSLRQAEGAYRRAITYDPRCADTHLQLGHVLKLQGKTEEAQAAYLCTLVFDPETADADQELSGLGWPRAELQELLESVSEQHKANVGSEINSDLFSSIVTSAPQVVPCQSLPLAQILDGATVLEHDNGAAGSAHSVAAPMHPPVGSSDTGVTDSLSMLPSWLQSEMGKIAEIEPELFLSSRFLEKMSLWQPMQFQPATVPWLQILSELGNRSFSHVFVLPWIKRGGADLEALHQIRALTSRYNAAVLVILTEDTDSPWLERLPDEVTVVQFGAICGDLNDLSKEKLLLFLLLKLKSPVIHNINSALGWHLYRKYPAALSSVSRLYVSLFCFDFTIYGERVGYATNIPFVHEHLAGVFCDNTKFPRELTSLYGVNHQLFIPLRYPARLEPRFVYDSSIAPKILWAGRLDRQKRVDILAAIARCLPNICFHVYGSTLLDDSDGTRAGINELRKLCNVKLFGEFDGFDSIPDDNYAMLLYTTEWDGMPNIILEAVAAGLCVLAPNVGGISDVVSSDSWLLVDKFDDVGGFVGMVHRALFDSEALGQERDKQQTIIREKYSDEQFINMLMKVGPYVHPMFRN